MGLSTTFASQNGTTPEITPRAPNFGESLLNFFSAHSESAVHGHVPAERANLFRSFSGEAAELETLTLLNALVGVFKPSLVLETGTGCGFATIALAAGLLSNGFGRMVTLDTNAGSLGAARQNAALVDSALLERIEFRCQDSREFIAGYHGEPFDFCFFDSLIGFRHLEFEALLTKGLLSSGAVCVWHDASRLRRETADDNSEMVAAIDRYSFGRQWLEMPFSRGLRIIRLGEGR